MKKLEIENRGDEPVEIFLPSFPPATLQPGDRVTLVANEPASEPDQALEDAPAPKSRKGK